MVPCLNSDCQNHTAKGSGWYVKTGYYKPKGSGQRTARYKCKACGKTFSSNTHRPTAYQKKRSINPRLFELLVSGVSLRRAAELLEVQYNTVLLHFDYLAEAAKTHHVKFLRTIETEFVQVDELETFIHARPKCVSVAMAVRVKTGQILGFNIARMPAKGKLAAIGTSLYDWTTDERAAKFQEMLSTFVGCLKPSITFKTDSNTNYPKWIAAVVPHAKLERIKGKNKKQPIGNPKEYDEMFAINNTFARMRHDMNRLARKTWSTSKAIHGLEKHLWLYLAWNNKYPMK